MPFWCSGQILVLECISANGSDLLPMILLQGKNYLEGIYTVKSARILEDCNHR